MSTLSKVFVVLVLIASVVFAMTSMARLATTEKFKQKYEEEQKTVRRLEGEKNSLQEQLTDEQRKHASTQTTLSSQIAAKDVEITNLKARNGALETELANIKTTLQRNSDNLATVKTELQEARTTNQRLYKELDAAVARADKMDEARRDAEQKLSESQNSVKNLLDAQKALDITNTRLIAENKRLDDELKAAERAGYRRLALVEETAGPKIDGVVTQVERRGTEVWVQLSVGSANDVKEGTRFIVMGGGSYKGDVRVETVSANSSVGRVVQAGTKEIVAGDIASTQLE